jgi:glycosyltransferase involved in cell wall biosynthesis
VTGTRARLAIVASHPVQYQAPWYRALARLVDLRVFFAHRLTPADHARSGFGVEFDWDASIFEGYAFEWLTNRARRPGPDSFRGCDTPDVGRRLVEGRFDAVVVNGWNLLTYWQAIYAARRAGLSAFVRGDSHLVTDRSRLLRLAKRLCYPRLLKSFDACLAVGTWNAEYYRRYGVPDSRIYRSPHCVDNDFFARGAAEARADIAADRRELGVPADAVVFALAGRLVDVKRPLDFVRALDEAARVHRNIHGLIIGDGPLRPALEAHCRANATACAFSGFLNQNAIARAYGAADCLVLPSAGEETWGLVVNEAMAAGLPAIVTDQVGCAPDLIVDGQTGFTYPSGDVRRLAESIGRVAADGALRQAMRAHVTSRIAAFSPDAAAAGVIAALDGVRSVGIHRGRKGSKPSHVIDALS